MRDDIVMLMPQKKHSPFKSDRRTKQTAFSVSFSADIIARLGVDSRHKRSESTVAVLRVRTVNQQ
jgi:hypothetical protein